MLWQKAVSKVSTTLTQAACSIQQLWILDVEWTMWQGSRVPRHMGVDPLAISAFGMLHLCWDIDTGDWQDLVTDNTRPGYHWADCTTGAGSLWIPVQLWTYLHVHANRPFSFSWPPKSRPHHQGSCFQAPFNEWEVQVTKASTGLVSPPGWMEVVTVSLHSIPCIRHNL